MRRLFRIAVLSAAVAGWAEGVHDGYRERDLKTVRGILDAVGWNKVSVASVVGNATHSGMRVNCLDLSWKQGRPRIEQLPAEIAKLPELQKLTIADNALEQLPKAIGDLRGLLGVNLNGNQLDSLPVEITYLSQLRTLSASNNSLKKLPAEIGELQLLRTLRLDYNKLSSLPESIRGITYVKVSLLGNRLCEVSDSMDGWLRAHFAPGWRDVQICEGAGGTEKAIYYGAFMPEKEPGSFLGSVVVDEALGVTVRLRTSGYVVGSVAIEEITGQTANVPGKEKLRVVTITASDALASAIESAELTMSYAGLTGDISQSKGIAIHRASQEAWHSLEGRTNPLAREVSARVNALGTFGLFRSGGPNTATSQTTVQPASRHTAVRVQRMGTGIALTLESHAAQPVAVAVYGPRGRAVGTIDNRLYTPGTHRITWTPTESVARGLYVVGTTVGSRRFTHQILLGE